MEKVRLQKIIADSGYCSRRKAEEYIEQGCVKVNGRPVSLGDKADPKNDIVTVNGEKIASLGTQLRYIKLYKPRGYVTTMADTHGRKIVTDLLDDIDERVYPVGRLDKDSEGLLLMTNRGDLINEMMRAAHYHEKEYEVVVDRPFTDRFLNDLAAGVYLKELDVTTRPCQVQRLGKRKFSIVLTQGLNRQIRRMCGELGYHVQELKRTRIMNIRLGHLKTGTWRNVTEEELQELLYLLEESGAEAAEAAETEGAE